MFLIISLSRVNLLMKTFQNLIYLNLKICLNPEKVKSYD